MNIDLYPSLNNLFKVITGPTIEFIFILTPRSKRRSINKSINFLGNLNSGIPYAKTPPILSFFSKIVTSYPFLASSNATVRPAGPEPIIATFIPLLSGFRTLYFLSI